MTGAFATIYDGSCRMEVVNDNSNLSGRFSITIRFESQYNDERYKSAIQTILQVFGMDSNDIHMLTDGFISDNSMRYTFDESYVSQHYHDKLRVSFESSQKRMGKVRPMTRGKIKITTYDYPAGRYITDKAE